MKQATKQLDKEQKTKTKPPNNKHTFNLYFFPYCGYTGHKYLSGTCQGIWRVRETTPLPATPLPAEHAKSIIDKAIRKEWKRKWNNAPHYKHTKLFSIGLDKNKGKCILNLSRSHLTKLMSITMGFNCFSYIQFKADPTINPLCRLPYVEEN